jgi:chromate transporter
MTHTPPNAKVPLDTTNRPTVAQLALLFLRLGVTSFGGPAAHLALMEDEIVERRRWLTRAEFLDMVAAANLIPGPNSTEVAIHVGLRAGWMGFLVAGVCFILPAALLVTLLGWAYQEFGGVHGAEGLLFGVKPVVIAVVLQALWRFARTSIRSPGHALLAVGAVLLTIAGIDELLLLLAGGLLVALWRRLRRRPATNARGTQAMLPAVLLANGAAANAAAVPVATAAGLWPLFLVFLKIGSVLFGSGYVLLAFLRTEFVQQRNWLTEGQLLDAVAVGQITPGPLFTSATFIGFLLHGPAGAAVATIAIFLPAFVFVALSGPLVPWLRRSPTAGACLDGVIVASLALMAVVSWDLTRAALLNFNVADGRFWLALTLLVVSAVLLIRFRLNAAWLVLGGAAVGVVSGA